MGANANDLFSVDDAISGGRSGGLRNHILRWVHEESYDRAIAELRNFDQLPSSYPAFHDRVRRYIMHSIDLIYAIKAKRHFHGLNSLTRAKQQELRDKFMSHLRELDTMLRKIEKVETDLRINDVRSTIYVVKALWFAGAAVIFVAFTLEIARGLAQTAGIVTDDFLNRATEWIFTSLGM